MKNTPLLRFVLPLFVAGALLVGWFARAADPAPVATPVPYPEGYRDWTHVKTGLIGPDHKGFATNGGYHHIYANAKAMEGYRTGTFPDGAIIVFDRLAAVAEDGAFKEGARHNVDLMYKDATRYAATGGWGFERFKGDSKTERVVAARAATACFECHAKREANGYVFSEFRK